MWYDDPKRLVKTAYDVAFALVVATLVMLFSTYVDDVISYVKEKTIAVLYAFAIFFVILGIIAFIKRFFLTSIIIVASLVAFGAYDANYSMELIRGNTITLKDWITFIMAIVGICFLAVRMENQNQQLKIQDEQLNIQIQQLDLQNQQLNIQSKQVNISDKQAEIQDKQVEIADKQAQAQSEQNLAQMFNAAVASLGSNEESARTQAIYSLYHLALDNEKYRVQIAQILCSHIRSKTREGEYQVANSVRPTNEIQTTINLLFKDKGLYCEFKSGLPKADLSHAWLKGADFSKAHCEEASFIDAHCQRVNFRWAHCEGAKFTRTHCEGADFIRAHCEGAEFFGTHCEGADFIEAHCEGADCMDMHCEGANFCNAYCQGTCFAGAYCQGAFFYGAHCQDADFGVSHCEGTEFTGAYCQGAIFIGAHCHGACANSRSQRQMLADRIGKNTELNDMIVSGEFAENAIDNIERARRDAEKFMPDHWYSKMRELVSRNDKAKIAYGEPGDINKGILEDSEDLRALVKKLDGIKNRNWPYL